MNTSLTTLFFVLSLLIFEITFDQDRRPGDTIKSSSQTEPIEPMEKNWNVIMSLVYAPAFSNLKQQIGSESSGNKIDFVSVQKDALIIAEFTARIHQWPDFQKFESKKSKSDYLAKHKRLEIQAVRDHAAKIYTSAKKEHADQARKNFIAMTESCNVCHQQRKSSWVPLILEP